MRVTMKGPIDYHLLEVGREQFFGDSTRIKRVQLLTAHVGQVPAMHKTERQHAARGVFTIHGGGGEQLKVSNLFPNQSRAVGLQPEVKLLAQAALQLAHDLQQAVAFAKVSVPRGKAGYLLQNLNVDLYALTNAGALYFH